MVVRMADQTINSVERLPRLKFVLVLFASALLLFLFSGALYVFYAPVLYMVTVGKIKVTAR